LVIAPGAGASTEGPELWVGRYDGPGDAFDQPSSVATSADGSKVFVAGWSQGTGSGYDYATVMYDAAGAQLWASRYNGPGNGDDVSYSMVASPDGSKVFVTGGSWGITSGATPGQSQARQLADPMAPSGGFRDGYDYATVTYDAAGAQLWVSRYDGPAHAEDTAFATAASPDGSKVFVTGRSWGIGSGSDYATVAYNAATGAQLWVSRYNGPGNGPDEPHWLTVSPDGTDVFVTGVSVGTTGYNEYATLAYDAVTGTQQWVRRYSGQGIGGVARSMTVSPDGTALFVTGVITMPPTQSPTSCTITTGSYDWATVAYVAATGTQKWVRRYSSRGAGDDEPHSILPSPDGTKVFVTGRTAGTTTCWDYTTVAYNATNGGLLWRKVYNGPASADDAAHAMAVSPDGSKVFVTGVSWGGTSADDYATIAYHPATGAQLWVQRYNGPATGKDNASAMAVTPDGTKVLVTGGSWGGMSAYDYATVAYAA
jgi:hypothetical protein